MASKKKSAKKKAAKKHDWRGYSSARGGVKKTAAAKKKTAKKAAKKRAKRGFHLSAATKRKIGAKSKAHWKSITGKGTPKSHIPLEQLKKNRTRLDKTITLREKSPSMWK
jgi:hypothetical protein